MQCGSNMVNAMHILRERDGGQFRSGSKWKDWLCYNIRWPFRLVAYCANLVAIVNSFLTSREISQMRFEAINKSLFDHDVIFWLGDLNYRLETQNGFTNDDVRRLCSSPKTFRDMIAFDTVSTWSLSFMIYCLWVSVQEWRFTFIPFNCVSAN